MTQKMRKRRRWEKMKFLLKQAFLDVSPEVSPQLAHLFFLLVVDHARKEGKAVMWDYVGFLSDDFFQIVFLSEEARSEMRRIYHELDYEELERHYEREASES